MKITCTVVDPSKVVTIGPWGSYESGWIPLTQQPSSPPLYDGLTAERCLERYQQRQRSDGAIILTAPQLSAARELWSTQLRAKVADSAVKDRNRITIDPQDEP